MEYIAWCLIAGSMLQDKAKETQNMRFWVESLQIHAGKAPTLLIGTRAGPLSEAEQAEINSSVLKLQDETSQPWVHNKGRSIAYFPVENSFMKTKREKSCM